MQWCIKVCMSQVIIWTAKHDIYMLIHDDQTQCKCIILTPNCSFCEKTKVENTACRACITFSWAYWRRPLYILQLAYFYLSNLAVLAEWLRRQTRNLLGSARTGSNPVDCADFSSTKSLSNKEAINNKNRSFLMKISMVLILLTSQRLYTGNHTTCSLLQSGI